NAAEIGAAALVAGILHLFQNLTHAHGLGGAGHYLLHHIRKGLAVAGPTPAPAGGTGGSNAADTGEPAATFNGCNLSIDGLQILLNFLSAIVKIAQTALLLLDHALKLSNGHRTGLAWTGHSVLLNVNSPLPAFDYRCLLHNCQHAETLPTPF